MVRVITITEARSSLAQLAQDIEAGGPRVLVTRSGQPSFALVDPRELEGVERTWEIWGNLELVESIQEALLEVEADQVSALDGLSEEQD